jgi:peptide deformylase
MALRRVLQIEQAADAAVLRSKATRITSFDKSLQPLIDDMIETMRETDGVGLAAPQVGVLRRVVVIEQPAQFEEQEDGSVREIAPPELVVMINPEIIKASEETITMQEGCLSMPGRYGDVPRASWVTIKYQDIHGKEQRIRHAY